MTILGLIIVMALGIALYISRHTAAFEVFITEIGVLGPLVSIALQTLLGASPIPAEPVTMLNGVLFGPLRGTLYSWLGYMFASLIEYRIGMQVGQITDFEKQKRKLPLGLGRFPADSPWFLMLARVVPGYGPKMVGLIGGVYRVPVWRYIWTGAIPSLIGAALFAYGGSVLKAFSGG